MKKVLHLICNSHIDPVWQWDWDEGAAAALSTFYAACNLLDKYDFIFCHNEVLIYQYIERYDKDLFARIQKLVEAGKWKIMGGWYVQPDCLVPSGESFIRQCTTGREFFQEKFNARPRVALNFDSFGHTKGLPQILKKCGFDSYIMCRPLKEYAGTAMEGDMPHGPFLWEAYDGSRIKALRYEDLYHNYTTPFGKAKEAIEKKMTFYEDLDRAPILWGVGNHGGVSSEKDLEDIMVLQNEKKGEYDIIHSTLEDYFDAVEPTQVYKKNIYVFTKSFSSVSGIKLAHDQLENALYLAEKICTAADIAGKYKYNKEVFVKAEETLCQIAFHDVLSGTAIKTGTDSAIRKAYRSIEDLKEEMLGAFFKLASDLPKPTPNDDNIVVLNPYPYEYNDLIEAELYCPVTPEYPKEIYKIKLYDINGNELPYQIIKEESNIAIQHRVRLIFKAKIPAFGITQFGAHFDFQKYVPYRKYEQNGDILVKDDIKEVKISRSTGLLESFKVNGVEYLAKPAGLPMIFNDNEDPWGWRVNSLGDNIYNENGWPQGKGAKMQSMKLDNSGKGPYTGLLGVNLVEDGDILTEVQCLFSKGVSYAVIDYKIYKNTNYIDMNVHTIWNEQAKGLKLMFPVNGNKSYFAQMAFGIEQYKNNNHEYPSNRYVGNINDDKALVIYNRSGLHSTSKKGQNLYITLLNGSAYCAHPTAPELSLVDKGRFNTYVEQGIHDFEFRMMVNKVDECERFANEFNQPVYKLLHFPHGNGENVTQNVITLSNKNIAISALKKRNNGTYLIRLYNGSFDKTNCTLNILGVSKEISFSKFAFKTFVYDGQKIVESKDSSIY